MPEVNQGDLSQASFIWVNVPAKQDVQMTWIKRHAVSDKVFTAPRSACFQSVKLQGHKVGGLQVGDVEFTPQRDAAGRD